MSGFKKISLILRLHQLPAGLVPVLAGLAFAFWKTERLDFPSAGAVLLLTALTQLGSTYLNDYFDHRSGVDWKTNSRTLFSSGSGLIQSGAWKAENVLLFGTLALGLAALLAVWLIAARSDWMLSGIFVFGILSGIFYTAPPFSAAYRGWGEVLIAANYGPTATELGYAALTGKFSLPLLLVSAAFSSLILAVNHLHEMLDYEADCQTGKKSWVVLLGPARSKNLLFLFLLLPYLVTLLSVALELLPWAALLPLATARWAWKLRAQIKRAAGREELYRVLTGCFRIYAAFGLAFAAGLILDAII